MAEAGFEMGRWEKPYRAFGDLGYGRKVAMTLDKHLLDDIPQITAKT
jgi:hypothetical protein